MNAKHFMTETGSRFALAIDGDMFIMSHLAGPAPRPGHAALAIEIWPELQAAANEAAGRRRNPYAVEKRVGMSGAEDYLLRECRDIRTGNFPVRATVHVSMYGKLNRGLELWLGDLTALCWHLFLNHPVEEGQTVREVPVFEPAWGWQTTPLQFQMKEDGGLSVAAVSQEDDQAVAWGILATLDKEEVDD